MDQNKDMMFEPRAKKERVIKPPRQSHHNTWQVRYNSVFQHNVTGKNVEIVYIQRA